MTFALVADLVLYGLVLFAGLAAGSYLNVLVTRLPLRILAADGISADELGCARMDPSSVRSLCPCCGVSLRWYDNVPLVSYILLKGKCRSCQAAISIRYPLAEVMVAFAALFAVALFGMTWHALGASLFFWLLIAVAIIDFETGLIPDLLSFGGLMLGLTYAAFTGAGTEAVWGAVLGYGSLWALATAYRVSSGQDGMGQGDLKLAAMLGAWLGPMGLWLCLTIAFVTGTLFALVFVLRRSEGLQMAVPFGPFLCLGAATAFLVQESGVDWITAWTNFVLGY